MPAWASRETRGALWCCKLLCADFFASDPGGGFEVFHERAFLRALPRTRRWTRPHEWQNGFVRASCWPVGQGRWALLGFLNRRQVGEGILDVTAFQRVQRP